MKSRTIAGLVSAFLLVFSIAGEAQSLSGSEKLERRIRHELITLPYYDIFEHLAFRVSPDGTVTLMGSVSRPTLKTSAENVVKDVEGVTRVENRIEVQPLSPNDDRIRRMVFRSIYGQPGLDRYGFQAVPSIHIIVKNGNVTLEGVVNSEADRDMAALRASGVEGVFAVKNNLRIEQERLHSKEGIEL